MLGFHEVIVINELRTLKMYKNFKIKHNKQVTEAVS